MLYSMQAALVFREKVFATMRDHYRISEGLMERMRNWRHSGFSVHKSPETRNPPVPESVLQV